MIQFIKKIFSSSKQTLPNPAAEVQIKAAVVSDVGMVRTNNEDNCLFVSPKDAQQQREKGFLAIVADGMGGHAAGEIASQLAVDIISQTFKNQQSGIEKALKMAFLNANAAIYKSAQTNQHQKGMGTTCTAVVLKGQELYYAHVGDSRLYALNKNGFIQISQDHTYVNELVKQGSLSAEAALNHPERNVLSRAMGTQKEVIVDADKVTFLFEANDKLLLCTDGLYDYLEDAEMAHILKTNTINDAAQNMVNLAKQRGGHDNITVIVLTSENDQEHPKNIRSTLDFELRHD